MEGASAVGEATAWTGTGTVGASPAGRGCLIYRGGERAAISPPAECLLRPQKVPVAVAVGLFSSLGEGASLYGVLGELGRVGVGHGPACRGPCSMPGSRHPAVPVLPAPYHRFPRSLRVPTLPCPGDVPVAVGNPALRIPAPASAAMLGYLRCLRYFSVKLQMLFLSELIWRPRFAPERMGMSLLAASARLRGAVTGGQAVAASLRAGGGSGAEHWLPGQWGAALRGSEA